MDKMTGFDKFCVILFPIAAVLVTILAYIDKQPFKLGGALLFALATFNIYKKYNQTEEESTPEAIDKKD